MNTIYLKKISKNFGEKIVLNKLDLEFTSNKIYGLLGNNGVGKTTLTKIIFNEIEKQNGSILYNNFLQKDINYKEWFLFSENDEFNINITVKQYLEYNRKLVMISKEVFKNRFESIKKMIRIDEFFNEKINKLSSGQKKLLTLAICLILKPKVIFFDEPTANVDIENKKIILNVIKELKKIDSIIVVITHLIEEIKDILDYVVILDSGKITYSNQFNSNKENISNLFEKNTINSNKNNFDIKGYINNEK